MIDDNDPAWVPAILVTFLAIAMATVIVVFARIPRKLVVSELTIYPIKSCGPMGVSSATVTATGFSHDRFAQISDSEGECLTPRGTSNARLFHIRPTLVVDNDELGSSGSSLKHHLHLYYRKSDAVENQPGPFRIQNLEEKLEKSTACMVTPISGPDVKLLDLGDDVAEWISNASKIKGCRLTAIGSEYGRTVEKNPHQGEAVPLLRNTENGRITSNGTKNKTRHPPVSLADEAPFLLATTSSLHDLNARLGVRGKAPVDMQRFRPNIVVHGTQPWEEDTWKRVRIGRAEFEVWQRCGRCSMTTIDRETLERGPEPLATLSTFRERAHGQRNFGMHMIPVMPNSGDESSGSAHEEGSPLVVKVGDTLEVLEYHGERLEEWKRLFDRW
mmetsp:Transcript_59/g.142  ORF Transcript_59/g.142 Transcript_59/m.142 type:complete len:387 (+) Transcript_59:313-1473(+)